MRTFGSLAVAMATAMALALLAANGSPGLASGEPDPPPGDSRPDPEAEAMFHRTRGWVGGDGIYSIELGPDAAGQTLWVFGDTFVGEVRDGRRVGCTMVNNTWAMQTPGPLAAPRLEYGTPGAAAGSPRSWIAPPPGTPGWFWPLHGAWTGTDLVLFLVRVEATGEGGAFGFAARESWMAKVPGGRGDPSTWEPEPVPLPFPRSLGRGRIAWGSAVLVDRGWLWIYGTEEDPTSPVPGQGLVLARVPRRAATDFASWRFLSGGRFVAAPERLDRVLEGAATELTVSRIPGLPGYTLVQSEGGLSPRIELRRARRPEGPWSPPHMVTGCDLMQPGSDRLCYAAKAHPGLSDPERGVLVTYATNSTSWDALMEDASLYFPRAVRVPLAAFPPMP